jgi:hypothetical protein
MMLIGQVYGTGYGWNLKERIGRSDGRGEDGRMDEWMIKGNREWNGIRMG